MNKKKINPMSWTKLWKELQAEENTCRACRDGKDLETLKRLNSKDSGAKTTTLVEKEGELVRIEKSSEKAVQEYGTSWYQS